MTCWWKRYRCWIAAIGNWERSQASALMEQWLGQYGKKIELVLSNNDDMALGALDAMERAFGAIAEDDKVAWPPEGSPVMSVRCTKDVMRVADKVTVDGEFAFRLASLSGQFLIKLDTWADRRMKTKKDAADMAFLLQNVYVAYALKSDGLPPEVDINAEQFDVIVAGAEWMASDLRKMLTDEHRHFYTSMLRSELDKNEESPLLNDLLDVSDSRYYYLYRRAIERMAQILES